VVREGSDREWGGEQKRVVEIVRRWWGRRRVGKKNGMEVDIGVAQEHSGVMEVECMVWGMKRNRGRG